MEVCGVELTFEPREVILPENKKAVLRFMEKQDFPKVKDIVSEHSKSFNRHLNQQVSKDMLFHLDKWFYSPFFYFFIIGSKKENGDILGVTNGTVVDYGGEKYGSSKLTLNTSGVKNIGRELFRSKLDTFFSVPEIDIVYASTEDKTEKNKAKRILEEFRFDQNNRGKYYGVLSYKFSPHKPYSLSRENYEKVIRVKGHLT